MEIRIFAETILQEASLEGKLLEAKVFTDDSPSSSLGRISFPARTARLHPDSQTKSPKFPSLSEISAPSTRGLILHFFANHELLALELMALALIRFPEAPSSFRRGLVGTMIEEMKHLKLYLERMAELGVAFGDYGLSRFFWDMLSEMRTPLDFVTGMSMTFEQANLDYCLYYQQALKDIGDLKTAKILEDVYRDEITHVAHGVKWFEKWRDHTRSQWQAYQNQLNQSRKLSPARAKGLSFDRKGRLEAKLNLDFIAELERFKGPKGRDPVTYCYNADAELEWMYGRGYAPSRGVSLLLADYEVLPLLYAESGSLILCTRQPSQSFKDHIFTHFGESFEFKSWQTSSSTFERLAKSLNTRRLIPWAWTDRMRELNQVLAKHSRRQADYIKPPAHSETIFNKSKLVSWREQIRSIENLMIADELDDQELDGMVCSEVEEVLAWLRWLHKSYNMNAVAKADYGFSGSGLRRLSIDRGLTESDLGWIRNQLSTHGSLLVEPEFDIVMEFSLTWQSKKDRIGWNAFLSDKTSGRYLGAKIGPQDSKIPVELKRYWLYKTKEKASFYNRVLGYGEQIRALIRSRAEDLEACGVDLFLYKRNISGKLFLRPCSEINARSTMGHLSRALEKKLLPPAGSRWFLLSLTQARCAGFKEIKDLAQKLIDVDEDEGTLIFTNDWTQAKGALSVVIKPGTVARWITEKMRISYD